jgi:hypothetical protein
MPEGIPNAPTAEDTQFGAKVEDEVGICDEEEDIPEPVQLDFDSNFECATSIAGESDEEEGGVLEGPFAKKDRPAGRKDYDGRSTLPGKRS